MERLEAYARADCRINIPSTDGSDAGVSIDDYAATMFGHRAPDCTPATGISAFVGSAPTETNMRYSAEARLQGVIDAAAAHPGIELTPLSIQRGLGESNAALNAVLNASPASPPSVLRMMKWPHPCCIACVNTGGGYPQDISIIGFDDSTLSAAVGLTTLHQDPFAMGVAAGHMVLDAIAGKSIEPAFVRPDTPLILRETTAPPAATAASAQA